ncbi:extracellular solute-binding protein [Devosia rhodophyticola]|uniref:Extracellular solute-binding protein n=1 Tax=Devosia rhodophyticola TaxID=3026423 RepID=A0ABY7Z1T8_9HYPH|nr:extracellular solute-binding protein [Devosia rhodophyticola]WDR06960.1 extracellular solute-binding protein [Devosia rhodophyticola]
MSKRTGFLGALLLGTALTFGSTAMAEEAELWHFFSSGSEAEGLEALMAVTNGINSDQPITSRVFPGNILEMRRAIQTSLMGGNPPAAYGSGFGYELKIFADAGHLRPLDDVWERIRGDEIFPEGVKRVTMVDGHPMGIPFDLSLINNIFFNKKVLEDNGVEVPTDWDSLVAACDALRDAGVQPLANAGGPYWSMYNFYPALISTVGVDGYYALADGSMSFDSPEFREALDLFRNTLVSCYAENWSGKSWTQSGDDLVNGDVGMFMMGMWLGGYMRQAGFEPEVDFDFFPAPGTENLAIFQMDLFAIPAGTGPATEAGVAFAEAAASTAAQAAFTVPKGSIAPNLEVDPSIYDAVGAKASAELKNAEAVLPNLVFMLPTNLGTELGVQLERFAIDPSEETENEMITTLEALRVELQAENAFVKW